MNMAKGMVARMDPETLEERGIKGFGCLGQPITRSIELKVDDGSQNTAQPFLGWG